MRSNKASDQVVKEIYMCPTEESNEDDPHMMTFHGSLGINPSEFELAYEKKAIDFRSNMTGQARRDNQV